MSEENVITLPTPKPCPYCQQDCAPESVRCPGCGCPLRLGPSSTPEELRTWAQKLREQAAAHEEHARELRAYVERRRNEKPGKEQGATSENAELQAEPYWGLCPKCMSNDGFLSVGRDHWFVCHKHRVKWWVGSGLFSCPDESDWDRNRELLSGYRNVKPVDEASA